MACSVNTLVDSKIKVNTTMVLSCMYYCFLYLDDLNSISPSPVLTCFVDLATPTETKAKHG